MACHRLDRLLSYNQRMRTFLAGMLCMIAATAQGQDPRCTSLKSEVTLGPFSGEKIDSVLIETAKPNLGKLGRLVARLHVMTHRGVIQRELLFAPGDTVDTLMIAESLRRLRALAFLEYARVEGRRCRSGTGQSLALSVVTRDAWTTRPDLKVGSAAPRIGLTERNLFGTGRTVSLDVVSRNGSIGAGVTAFDSFGFGSGATARGQYQRYSDGSTRSLFLSRRQATVADRWRASFGVVDQVSEPRAAQSDNFERSSGELIAGLRLTPGRSLHAIYLIGGVESEQGSLSAAPNSQVVGPLRVDRRFVGPQLGTAIVSTRYDTLTWLLAGGSVIDAPRTVEGEIVIGMGKGTVSATDSGGPALIATSNFMTHYDGWLGREWLPNRASRVVSDLWASGYSRSGEWHSGRLRATVLAEHAASKGVWRIFAASERLKDPDPDVRALGIYDRALAFVPSRVRLAESAFTMSLERTRHLRPIGGTLELDASVFGALSKRWDPSSAATSAEETRAEDVSVSVAGIGLSLSPRRAGRATIRLDYGFPILASGISRKPRFSVSVVPWLEAARHRDGSVLF